MFGTYQNSSLRIEISANSEDIKASLTQRQAFEKWLWPQQFQRFSLRRLSDTASSDSLQSSSSGNQQSELIAGEVFESQLGIVSITHEVETITGSGIRFLLSGSIDGFHEWQWGDGWVQSRLEGVSLLPLGLGQTLSLTRLKQYLQ